MEDDPQERYSPEPALVAAAMKWLVATEEGKTLLGMLVRSTGIYTTVMEFTPGIPSDAMRIGYLEGRRDVGLGFQNLLMLEQPKLYAEFYKDQTTHDEPRPSPHPSQPAF